MFPPFYPKIAHEYCFKLKDAIDSGALCLQQVTRVSEERRGQGVMIGCLVCVDSEGNRVVLAANSGISKQIVNGDKRTDTCPSKQASWGRAGELPLGAGDFIIVPPIVSAEEIDNALRKNDREIHELTDRINKGENDLKSRRTALTTESLDAVHLLYKFARIDGTFFTLPKNQQVPTGTGDCCEPKLLHYAFTHGLRPVSMDQIYYDGVTNDFPSIPPCDERCGILLPEMLGLEVLYVDEHIVVVNKQSGLLSVPGRGEDKQDCIVNRVKKLYPDLCKILQPSVHRLDMETSGVLVLAFTEEAHKNLSRQFENREIEKEYVALLSGVLEKEAAGELAPKHGEKSGIIKLKFRLDVENRPHQIYDEVYGKEGITEWENLGLVWYTAPDGTKIKSTKIRFRPHTGRTHQLRLVSADSHGFGLPIIGDTLYGTCREGERLMLHAEKLVFTHPATGEKMEFIKPANFQ